MDAPADPAPKRRLSAHELLIRRDRIFARLLEGQSHAAIAEAEGITTRRVREIVDDGLSYEGVDPREDFVHVQVARLEEALRLIEQKIAEGKLNAIDRLLKVLAQLDRYHGRPPRVPSFELRAPGAKRMMMARLERAAASRTAVATRPTSAQMAAEKAAWKPEEGQAVDITQPATVDDASPTVQSMA